MQTTTTAQIREAIIDAVRDIVPRSEHLRDQPWAYRRPEEYAAGAEVRRYSIETSAARPVWGIFSQGEEYEFKMELRTAYGGVALAVLADLITLDGVDLREAIDNLRDPTCPGLIDVGYDCSEPGLVNESAAEAVHMFTLRYLQSTGLD